MFIASSFVVYLGEKRFPSLLAETFIWRRRGL